MAISTAISLDRVSRVIGYKLSSANFNNDTPYLPQRIAILGEANTANQATITEDVAFEFISANEVGEEFGYGSPLHIMARIIRPLTGNLLGGIPTVIYPQKSDVSATATVIELGVAGTVTENATHELIINGRNNIDGNKYSYTVVKGQTASDVKQTIADTINNVLSSPVTAVVDQTSGNIVCTTKWKGVTSAELDIQFNTNGNDVGLTYSIISKTDGAGEVSIDNTLANFGENWNTLVINPYSYHLQTLEDFNGVPHAVVPTGRYSANLFKPFLAFFGSTLSDKDDIVAITNATARKTQVTNVLSPAPNSKGFTFEAASNMCVSYAFIAQNTPHKDNSGKYYHDMPIPSDELIGDFSNYEARDYMVKRGASTVNITNGRYTIQDMVTTYAPDGVAAPKFRFVRDLMVDFNMEFMWRIIMERDIRDRAIIDENSVTNVSDVISAKQVKQLVYSHIDLAVSRGFISDAAFSKNSTIVQISSSNPARLDIFFRYKRTSVAHIVSSDVEVDFNYTI